MNLEDFQSTAHKEGVKAAERSRAEQHLKMDQHPNPYEYGSKEWQLWNYGWNTEIARNG